MKTKIKNNRGVIDATDVCLQRLARAPETAHQIYELAESLYMREDGNSARMTLADIERVNEYLRSIENDIEAMKKQFRDLATLEGSFYAEKIPTGF